MSQKPMRKMQKLHAFKKRSHDSEKTSEKSTRKKSAQRKKKPKSVASSRNSTTRAKRHSKHLRRIAKVRKRSLKPMMVTSKRSMTRVLLHLTRTKRQLLKNSLIEKVILKNFLSLMKHLRLLHRIRRITLDEFQRVGRVRENLQMKAKSKNCSKRANFARLSN